MNVKKLSEHHIKQINQQLVRGDQQVYDFLYDSIELFADEEIITLFGESFRKCEEVIESKAAEESQLPF